MSTSGRSNRTINQLNPIQAALFGSKKPSSTDLRSKRKAAIDNQNGNSARTTGPKLVPVQRSKRTTDAKPKKGLNLKLPFTPGVLKDSVKNISTLRELCKQCLGYVQQADTMLEQLHGTAKHLQEAGVLKRLAETKGKNLSSADLTTILFALMNSPLGSSFLGKLGSGNSANSEEKPAESEASKTPKLLTASKSKPAQSAGRKKRPAKRSRLSSQKRAASSVKRAAR